MKIEVNGKTHTFPAPVTLTELLRTLEIGEQRVAIEVNAEIVPRAEHGTRQVSDGDHVEVVHAIGGG